MTDKIETTKWTPDGKGKETEKELTERAASAIIEMEDTKNLLHETA